MIAALARRRNRPDAWMWPAGCEPVHHRAMIRTLALLALVASTAACGGKDDTAAATTATAAATAAPTGAAATKPAAPAANPAAASADDPVVCCAFNGVKGSSTKKLCEGTPGSKVAPDAECPTLKK